MGNLDMHEMKKQASLFLREKFKVARLALTDVTKIQLLMEEATNSDPWGPETRTLAIISDAAYEFDEYERIVHILHRRLETISKGSWRQMYKTLVVLEYLLTHGPERLANEISCDRSYINQLSCFNFLDERGINRGVSIWQKADKVLQFLNDSKILKEERHRAWKISSGIHGFGSDLSKKEEGLSSSNSTAESSVDKLPKDAVEDEVEGQNIALLLDEKGVEERQVRVDIEGSFTSQHDPCEKCISSQGTLKHNGMNGTWNRDFYEESKAQLEHDSLEENGGNICKKNLSSPCYLSKRNLNNWYPFGESPGEMDFSGSCVSEQCVGRNSEEIEDLRTKVGVSAAQIQEKMKLHHKSVGTVAVSLHDDWHPCERDVPLANDQSKHIFTSDKWPIEMKYSRQHSLQDPKKTSAAISSNRFLKSYNDKEQQSKPKFTQSLSLQCRSLQTQSFAKPPSLPPPPRAKGNIQVATLCQGTSLLDL